jgi:hypothetical protein
MIENEEISGEVVGVKKDMAIRWNSTYNLLARHYRLRAAIRKFEDQIPGKLAITENSDFATSQQILSVLSPWNDCTNVDQGDYICASLVVPVGRCLLRFHQKDAIPLIVDAETRDADARFGVATIKVTELGPEAKSLFEYLGREIVTYWGSADVRCLLLFFFYF